MTSKITNALATITLRADVATEDGRLPKGVASIRKECSLVLSQPETAFEFTAHFPAAGGVVTVESQFGSAYEGAVGARQVERATVTGTSTTAGNLAVTVTAAGVTGSPVALAIPLAAGLTPDQIATKIAAAINANVAISAKAEAWAEDRRVIMRIKVPAANDTTLNMAIAAGLGISAAATSDNVVTGGAGVEIARVGLSGSDVFGQEFANWSGAPGAIFIRHNGGPGHVFVDLPEEGDDRLIGDLNAGEFALLSCATLAAGPIALKASGACVIEFAAIS